LTPRFYRDSPALDVLHIDSDARDAGKLHGHKARVDSLLLSFQPFLIISAEHVPPFARCSPGSKAEYFAGS
jgi:hypothetical protein